MKNSLKITAVAERESAIRIWEALDAMGALAVTLENAADDLDCDDSTPNPPKWHWQAVSGLFDKNVDCESLISIVRQIAGRGTRITTTLLPERDWVGDSQQVFQPIQFAGNLWICPASHRPQPSECQMIHITPGLSFGTGRHPSTALCIERLATLQLNDMTVLDWGCGSGILALVALKLGASKALGVDVDYRALATTRENAAQNQVRDQMMVCRPEEVPHNFRFQLVIANLLARTLIELAPTLSRHLTDDGKLLVSGILEDQAPDIMSTFGSGYFFETVSRDGWTMIMATRQ